jgi:methylenetetrahydrofolate--tRNA-(uracil-5-)-methyltransferase
VKKSNGRVLVIGAGMAGSDAAFFLAERGVEVVLVEGKRIERNPAQKMVDFAELVCTNSLKSVQTSSAHGLLKQDMDALGSLILREARKAAVPAGDALAVDREIFSRGVTESLESHPNIQVVHTVAASPLGLQDKFNCDYTIVATGPLTSKPLEEWMVNELADDDFYFYDAIAPVVDADTLDYSKLYFKDRHKQADESADYLNAPMNQQQYEAFVNELIKADKVPAQNFEEYRFFESCLPVDLMAERGIDTPRFSCIKPICLEL